MWKTRCLQGLKIDRKFVRIAAIDDETLLIVTDNYKKSLSLWFSVTSNP